MGRATSDLVILSVDGRRERVWWVTFAITFGIVRQFVWFFWLTGTRAVEGRSGVFQRKSCGSQKSHI